MKINKLLKLANYFYKMATPLESLVIHNSVDANRSENIQAETQNFVKHYKGTTVNYRIIFIDNKQFKLETLRNEAAYEVSDINKAIINNNVISKVVQDYREQRAKLTPAQLRNKRTHMPPHMSDTDLDSSIEEYTANEKDKIDEMKKDLKLDFLPKGTGDTININIICAHNEGDIISPSAIDHDIAHAVFHGFNEGKISKQINKPQMRKDIMKAIKSDIDFPNNILVTDELCKAIVRVVLIGSNIISGSIGELNFIENQRDVDLMPDMLALYNLKEESFKNVEILLPKNLYAHNDYAKNNGTIGDAITVGNKNKHGVELNGVELKTRSGTSELPNLKLLLKGDPEKQDANSGILQQEAITIKNHLRSLNGRVIVLRAAGSKNFHNWIISQAPHKAL